MSHRFANKLAGTIALLAFVVAPLQQVEAATITPSGSYAASQQTYQQMWQVPTGYGSSTIPGGYVYTGNKISSATGGSNQVPNGSSSGNQIPNGGGSYGTFTSNKLPNYGYGSSTVPGGYTYTPGNKVPSGSGASSSNKLPNGSGVSNQVPNGTGSYGTYTTSNLPNYGGGNYGSSTVPGGYTYNPGNKVPNGNSLVGNKVPNGSEGGVSNKVPNGGSSDGGVNNKVPSGTNDGTVNNKVPNDSDNGGVNNKVPNDDDDNEDDDDDDRDTDDDGDDDISLCNDRPYPEDIDDHWAEIYVRRLYDLCIIEGYGDGSFKPNRPVTRAELVKMALYSKGIDPIDDCYDADCGSPFKDLDNWQGPWIRKAWDLGIVQGYDHDSFRPNKPITRAEAVKVVLATYGYDPMNTNDSFFDDVHGWSVGWVERAHEIGMVQGVGNGNFDPNRPITRAESAKVIAKMMEYWDTEIQ
ncbi:MAG TPA: S-layer homology domain-containing protein [Candidatus Gracilibacteria bacterium]|nr:S-layer homology domain-containing protein [Candidatus Gracilibacteria bacterium]